ALEGFILEGFPPRLVVTLNPEMAVLASRDQEFRKIILSASLVLPDGVGIILASRVLGTPLKERVTGVDTVERFAAMASKKGYRPFFLGASPGVAQKAASVLAEKYPGFKVAGVYPGSPSPSEEEIILELIKKASPDALFVAYGSPAQEKWLARNLPFLNVPFAMGVGGAFDFIAGVVPRAPKVIRRAGFEWLFRLIVQPWRWKRQLALPVFCFLVLKEKLSL
ncbi:MAG: WecB/TagA/CpsF family glycosyltransferase, partial [Anaerolineae bacterium]|nr:WecB/TagA/CpsF family glycosyltransferase [Anaerolineae bacterium]